MKCLIIRFSSFGDIVQALPSVSALHECDSTAQVDWLVRADFKELLTTHPGLREVIAFDRELGVIGLIALVWRLSARQYTHVYDAHNNVRSAVVRWSLRIFSWVQLRRAPSIVVRSKQRWRRFLFFKFRRPVLPQPFRGAVSFIKPIETWCGPLKMPPPPHLYVLPNQNFFQGDFIALVPSAAWPTKRWPLDSWKQLIREVPSAFFVVLGGPADSFCEELVAIAPDRVINLAGRCSLMESCAVVAGARVTISADTGLLHVADQLGVANIGLIGPTAFGYTSHPQSHILETSLYCKPCSKDGRDPCVNPVWQRCMKDITPVQVARTLGQIGEKSR